MSSADDAESRGMTSEGERPAPARSLATRLSVWYFGMSFLLIVLSSCLLYWGTVLSLRWADDQVLEKRMLTLRAILQQPERNEGYLGHEVSEDLEGPRRIFMRVISDTEDLRVETPNAPPTFEARRFPDVSAAPLDAIHRGTINTEDGQNLRVITARVPVAAGWRASPVILQVAVDTSLDEQVLAWVRRMLGALFGGAALLCWGAANYIVKRELRPLRQITSAAAKIGSETLSYRLELTGLPTELHELASQLNGMLARLEQAYDGLRQYADNVAHELRTPLHRMLLSCEVALLRARSIDEYRGSLESNLEECKRLIHIVKSVLFLARAEHGQGTIVREQIDVARELEVIRGYFEARVDEAGLTLRIGCPTDIKADVDRTLFQRAISNLVSNSIAHTPRSGSVSISAANHTTGVAIEVADTGEGIAPAHQARVFDRFYRADQIRAADDGRLGLGLPITKSIMELHRGTLSLKSEVGRGTSITLSFPSSPSMRETTKEKLHDDSEITESLS